MKKQNIIPSLKERSKFSYKLKLVISKVIVSMFQDISSVNRCKRFIDLDEKIDIGLKDGTDVVRGPYGAVMKVSIGNEKPVPNLENLDQTELVEIMTDFRQLLSDSISELA